MTENTVRPNRTLKRPIYALDISLVLIVSRVAIFPAKLGRLLLLVLLVLLLLFVHAQHVSLIIVLRVNFRVITMYEISLWTELLSGIHFEIVAFVPHVCKFTSTT